MATLAFLGPRMCRATQRLFVLKHAMNQSGGNQTGTR